MHTSPAVAELVDGDACHEQHQRFPLPYTEVALQYKAHQQRYHQDLQPDTASAKGSCRSCIDQMPVQPKCAAETLSGVGSPYKRHVYLQPSFFNKIN